MARQRAEGNLEGKEVVSADGFELGHLKDVEVETDDWRVTGLVVRLRRDVLEDIHLKKPLVGSQEIVVASTYVAGVGDKIVLSKKLEEFGQLTGADAHEG